MSRADAIKTGVRVEMATVAWLFVEAVGAIGAGVLARSVLLTAFGVDSAIELASGIVLYRRLSAESAGLPTDEVDRLESRTGRISAVLLVLLCAYVLLSSAAGLVLRVIPYPSFAGVAVSGAAIVAMPLLARAKQGVNRVLDSSSLRADIAETVSCAYLAAVPLACPGVSALNGLLGGQHVAAPGLLVWLVPEAREALHERSHNGHDQGGQGEKR